MFDKLLVSMYIFSCVKVSSAVCEKKHDFYHMFHQNHVYKPKALLILSTGLPSPRLCLSQKYDMRYDFSDSATFQQNRIEVLQINYTLLYRTRSQATVDI